MQLRSRRADEKGHYRWGRNRGVHGPLPYCIQRRRPMASTSGKTRASALKRVGIQTCLVVVSIGVYF